MNEIVSQLALEINDLIDCIVNEITDIIKKNPEIQKGLTEIQESLKSEKSNKK